MSLAFRGFDVGIRHSLWRPCDTAARSEASAHAKPLDATNGQVISFATFDGF